MSEICNCDIIAVEKLDHKERKGSTLKWFVIAILPVANLYFLWKTAENISGHEKTFRKYEFIEHRKAKESTTLWFILFLVPSMLSILVSVSSILYYTSPSIFPATVGLALTVILAIIAAFIGLYMLWKIAEVVSGHEKTYEKYEALRHKGKKIPP